MKSLESKSKANLMEINDNDMKVSETIENEPNPIDTNDIDI